jgi:4,5-DOPA dioxygenase extradiol
MPVLFVGHGSPMNTIEDNAYTRAWRDVTARIPRPKAILCVSAHWETRGVAVSTSKAPETIHDFYGFPQALFDVRYPAPGDPALARRIADIVKTTQIHGDDRRGLDHGSWSVLDVMYPDADIPTIQLSLDTAQPGAFHYELGKQLAPLREEGVLILGSGNTVHNLRAFDFRNPKPLPWADRAASQIRDRIVSGEHASLIDWPSLGPDVALAVPSPEHYIPLLYVLGAQREGDKIHIFNDDVVGSIAMTSVLIG